MGLKRFPVPLVLIDKFSILENVDQAENVDLVKVIFAFG